MLQNNTTRNDDIKNEILSNSKSLVELGMNIAELAYKLHKFELDQPKQQLPFFISIVKYYFDLLYPYEVNVDIIHELRNALEEKFDDLAVFTIKTSNDKQVKFTPDQHKLVVIAAILSNDNDIYTDENGSQYTHDEFKQLLALKSFPVSEGQIYHRLKDANPQVMDLQQALKNFGQKNEQFTALKQLRRIKNDIAKFRESNFPWGPELEVLENLSSSISTDLSNPAVDIKTIQTNMAYLVQELAINLLAKELIETRVDLAKSAFILKNMHARYNSRKKDTKQAEISPQQVIDRAAVFSLRDECNHIQPIYKNAAGKLDAKFTSMQDKLYVVKDDSIKINDRSRLENFSAAFNNIKKSEEGTPKTNSIWHRFMQTTQNILFFVGINVFAMSPYLNSQSSTFFHSSKDYSQNKMGNIIDQTSFTAPICANG
ncbi:MAG: hypothetical protein AAGG80_01155 [Pseudomonadota bacterium]